MILHSRPRAFGAWMPKLPVASIPAAAAEGQLIIVNINERQDVGDALTKTLKMHQTETQIPTDAIVKQLTKILGGDQVGFFDSSNVMKIFSMFDTIHVSDTMTSSLVKTLAERQDVRDDIAKSIRKALDERQDVSDGELSKSLGKTLDEPQAIGDALSKSLRFNIAERQDVRDDIAKVFQRIVTESQDLADAISKSIRKTLSEPQDISDDLTKRLVKNITDELALSDSVTHTIVTGTPAPAPVFIESIIFGAQDLMGITVGSTNPTGSSVKTSDPMGSKLGGKGFRR